MTVVVLSSSTSSNDFLPRPGHLARTSGPTRAVGAVVAVLLGATGCPAETGGFTGDTDISEEDEIPSCHGTPLPCELLSYDGDATCYSAPGCIARQSHCIGTPATCGVRGELDCAEIEGCHWDSAEGRCAGTSDPCYYFDSNPLRCERQRCVWSEGSCAGRALECNVWPVQSACNSVPGCFWGTSDDEPPPDPDTEVVETSDGSDAEDGHDAADSTETVATETIEDVAQETSPPDVVSGPMALVVTTDWPRIIEGNGRVEVRVSLVDASGAPAPAPVAVTIPTVSGDATRLRWATDVLTIPAGEVQVETHIVSIQNDFYDGVVDVSMSLGPTECEAASWSGLSASTIVQVVDDEDGAGISLAGLPTIAEGESGAFEVRLASQPYAPVVVTCGTGDDAARFQPIGPVTIQPEAWEEWHEVVVTAKADAIAWDDESIAIRCDTTSVDPAYVGQEAVLTVLLTDPDERGIVLAIVDGTLAEPSSSPSGSFNVRLASEPTASVNVRCSGSGLTFDQPIVEFEPATYTIAKLIRVTAPDDHIDQPGTTYALPRIECKTWGFPGTDPEYYGLSATIEDGMQVVDDDVARVEVTVVDAIASEVGDEAVVHARLATIPTSAVKLRPVVTPSNELLPASLEFPVVYGEDVALRFQGIDDLVKDGDRTVGVRFRVVSADLQYDNLSQIEVQLVNRDGNCGNDVVDGAETCDSGGEPVAYCGDAPCDQCDASCSVITGPWCGDGVVSGEHLEACDTVPLTHCADRWRTSGDVACDATCLEHLACSGDLTWVKVVAGAGVTCALSAVGSVDCWGAGTKNVHRAPMGVGFLDVDLDQQTACAVRVDGSVVCWGEHPAPPSLPPGPYVKVIVSGFVGVCGMRDDGSIGCGAWSTTPFVAPTGSGFKAFDGGADHACALAVDGSIVCWGDDTWGEASPPVGAGYLVVTAGFDETCAIKANHSFVCWGRVAPNPPSGTYSAIAAGSHANCAVEAGSGEVRCWSSDSNHPLLNESLGAFDTIAVGADHACGFRSNGKIICWGKDANHETWPPDARFETIGQCAVTTDGRILCSGYDGYKVKLNNVSGKVHVAGGTAHVCALDAMGAAQCWGDNLSGQATAPTNMAFRQLALGTRFSCGLKTSGGVHCWGSGPVTQTEPATTDFVRIAAGTMWACGLREDASVVCWSDMATTPQPPAGVDFLSLHLYGEGACGLDTEGDLRCWGFSASYNFDLAGPFVSADTYGCGLMADGIVRCHGGSEFRVSPETVRYVGGSLTADGRWFSLSHGLKCGDPSRYPCTPP